MVVDLGSQYGHVSRELQNSRIEFEKLYQVDLSGIWPLHSLTKEKMLLRDIQDDDSNYPRVKPIRVVADEEFLPFAPQSVDLVLSNLSLHWVNDLPGALTQIQEMLKPNGVFLATLWGAETLQEWRSAFAVAEEERLGGVSPHLSPFAGLSDLGSLLTRTRWALPTVDTELLTLRASDPLVILRDVQGMGENGAPRRQSRLNRSVLTAATTLYRSLYGNDDGTVPATFQVNYIIGWSPHSSQPKVCLFQSFLTLAENARIGFSVDEGAWQRQSIGVNQRREMSPSQDSQRYFKDKNPKGNKNIRRTIKTNRN